MTWRDLPAGAGECLETLETGGYAAYPVGGCVRDLLLGRAPGDVDICTSAHPSEVMALFPRAVPTGLRHGTVTVPTDEGNVEITTFRREEGYADFRHPDEVNFDVGLREDLSRRDFTVNAMALDREGTVIDFFGGGEDLKRGVIRCVGDPDVRFSEDALRMLRAARFAAQLGFVIEKDTAAALPRNARLVERVSKERIKAELEKTLLSPRPQGVGLMVEAGLLDHLYTFPRHVDLSGLECVPSEQNTRWREFCRLTGFPIAALPVERALRRAVEHPEAAVIPTLALRPGELMAFGLEGPQISAAQKRLACHVLEHPEDNVKEKLKRLLWNGTAE